jgi:hypothetical protein
LKLFLDFVGGGAWPFLVGGVICLVNSVNERDRDFLIARPIVYMGETRDVAGPLRGGPALLSGILMFGLGFLAGLLGLPNGSAAITGL